jgi:hypothetical protein
MEDLVQAVSSQERELAEKRLLVADLQEQLACSGNFLLPFNVASIVPFCFSTNALQYFRHADAAKLESTLEGVKKGHAIAMEGLNIQLRKSLDENTRLKEQLKDQERLSREKQKEVDDLRQAAIDFENQRKGFNEVLDHF